MRCGTCAMPFTASGLAQHMRRDPADGARRCPSALRADAACALVIDGADEAFVRGLSADEVYISSVPSLVERGGEAGCDVGAIQGLWVNVKTLNPALRKVLEQPGGGVRTPQHLASRGVRPFQQCFNTSLSIRVLLTHKLTQRRPFRFTNCLWFQRSRGPAPCRCAIL